jgi:murein DD-endopeptidase MepM/ murein hydrolase activator NlpD
MIQHSGEKQTLYAHAHTILVKVGQNVRKGQIIATGGMSGNATGPHLHFEVRYKGKTYNPLNYLR